MGSSNQTTYSQSFTPSWYTDYAKQIASNQMATSGQPYQPYTGARVAGFNPTQTQGFEMTKDAATAGTGAVQNALDVTQGTLGRSALGAAQPYINRAADTSYMRGVNQNFGNAGQAIGASVNPLGMQAAAPALNQAGQTSVSQVGQYMNPYIENVVNRYGELGARTLNEQLMPAITNKYISAGQLGAGGIRPGSAGSPSGMMTDSARALRDVQEGVAKQQQQALASGYSEALGAANTDLSRQLQVGQTWGQLGQKQQDITQGAGQAFGQLGTAQGQLGQGQQNLQANLGQMTGNMYNTDTSNALGAAQQMGALGGQQQGMAMTGAKAVSDIGAQQQGLEQKGLDVNYENYLREQGWPQAQIDQQVKTMQGIGAALPQGQVQMTSSKTPNASLLSTLGSAAATAAGLGAFK